jgi:hypothetical protein
MTDQDASVNPVDDGVSDEDEAAIDEALDALTATATVEDEADDDVIVDDEVGQDDDDEFDEDDEPELEEEGEAPELAPHEVTVHLSEPDDFDDTLEPEIPVAAVPVTVNEQRLEQLEQVAQALTAAAVKKDEGRVRRKVSASATGAALVGAIPVILQLVGALNLSPELAATVSAAAATIAAFLTGYVTPERAPAVQPELASQVLKQP